MIDIDIHGALKHDKYSCLSRRSSGFDGNKGWIGALFYAMKPSGTKRTEPLVHD